MNIDEFLDGALESGELEVSADIDISEDAPAGMGQALKKEVAIIPETINKNLTTSQTWDLKVSSLIKSIESNIDLGSIGMASNLNLQLLFLIRQIPEFENEVFDKATSSFKDLQKKIKIQLMLEEKNLGEAAKKINTMIKSAKNFILKKDLTQADVIYRDVLSLFKKVSPDLIEGKNTLKSSIVGLQLDLNDLRRTFERKNFDLKLKNIDDLFGLAKKRIDQADFEGAFTLCTKISLLYSSLPESFLAEKVVLYERLFELNNTVLLAIRIRSLQQKLESSSNVKILFKGAGTSDFVEPVDSKVSENLDVLNKVDSLKKDVVRRKSLKSKSKFKKENEIVNYKNDRVDSKVENLKVDLEVDLDSKVNDEKKSAKKDLPLVKKPDSLVENHNFASKKGSEIVDFRGSGTTKKHLGTLKTNLEGDLQPISKVDFALKKIKLGRVKINLMDGDYLGAKTILDDLKTTFPSDDEVNILYSSLPETIEPYDVLSVGSSIEADLVDEKLKRIQTQVKTGDLENLNSSFNEVKKSVSGNKHLKLILENVNSSISNFDKLKQKDLNTSKVTDKFKELKKHAGGVNNLKTKASRLTKSLIKKRLSKARDYVASGKVLLARRQLNKVLELDPLNEEAQKYLFEMK